MLRADIYAAIDTIMRDLLLRENLDLRPETTAKDVPGWDSITHINLMVAVEERFGVRIASQEIEKIATVGDLVAIIESRTSR